MKNSTHRRLLLASATLCALLAPRLTAQKFQRDFGIPGGPEIGMGIVQVPGGYAVAGTGATMIGLGLDFAGKMVVEGCFLPFSPTVTVTPQCLKQTSGGGYIVAGEVQGWMPGLEIFLSKFNAAGVMQWFYVYRGDSTGLRYGTRVVELSGGGFAAIGNVMDTGMSRGVLLQTNANGILSCWEAHTYPGSEVRFDDLKQSRDGSIAIVGSISSPVAAGRQTLVLKTHCGGPTIWSSAYGEQWEIVDSHALVETTDGGLAVWGHFAVGSPLTGSLLLKVAGNGAFMWRNIFPTVLKTRPTLAQAHAGDLLMNGHLAGDGLVLKTDAVGALVLSRQFGQIGGIDEIFQVIPASDGGFVCTGSTQIVDGAPNHDIYVVKADATGWSGCNEVAPDVPVMAREPWVTPKQLQKEAGGAMYYLRFHPVAHCLTERELCYEPSCVKAPSAMALWLPFDEITGTSAFNVLSLAGAPNGMHMNAPTPAPGQVQGGLSFDGVDDYVEVPSYPAIDVGLGDFSIDAWIRWSAVKPGAAVILDKRTSNGTTTTGYSFFVYDGFLAIQLADGTHWNWVSSLPVPADGQWHFVAATVRRAVNGGLLYVDGQSSSFDPSLRPGSLSNSGVLRVGSRSFAQSGLFACSLDEVEVFRRALGVLEVRGLFEAGPKGKCREGCFLPQGLRYCWNQNSIAAEIWVCNATSANQTYDLSFQGLPVGNGYTVSGPTGFTPPTMSVTVPQGTCKPFSVTIAKPASMTAAGQVAGWEMAAESTTTAVFKCEGSLHDRRDLCGGGIGWDSTVALLPANHSASLAPVSLTNTSGQSLSLSYRFTAWNDDVLQDTSVLSLNGLPPGVPATGTLTLGPGAAASIPLSVEFVEFDGLGTFSVHLEADVDGDGTQDFLAGRALRCLVGNDEAPIYTGVAAPTTQGTPELATSGFAVLGNVGFQLRGRGLVANQASILFLSPVISAQPLPLMFLGGQPSSYLYLDPSYLMTLSMISNATGNAVLQLPIPIDPSLAGGAIHAQVFDVDFQLAYPLPLGNSRAMTFIVR